MDNSQLLDLIKNVFKPDKSFVFPKKGGRSFLYKWLDDYSCLCYSPSVDGAFCLPCVLFGDQFPAKKPKVKRLFSEPMSHWPDASSRFKRHVGLGSKAVSKSGLHESTTNKFYQLVGQATGKCQPIEVIAKSMHNKLFLKTVKSLYQLLTLSNYVAV